MRLFVYDMLVNVNVIYYVHVCEQTRWARSVGNNAIENLCIIIIISPCQWPPRLSSLLFDFVKRGIEVTAAAAAAAAVVAVGAAALAVVVVAVQRMTRTMSDRQ